MKNIKKTLELENLIEQGKILYAGINIGNNSKGKLSIASSIGLYLQKARNGEYKVTIDTSKSEDPHSKHDSEKIRKFKLLGDAVYYIITNYPINFFDMRLI